MVQQYRRSFNNGSFSSSSCVPPLEENIVTSTSLQSGKRTHLMTTNSASVLLMNGTNALSSSYSTISSAPESSISARPQQLNRVKKILSSKTSCITIVLVTFVMMFFSSMLDQDEFHHSSFRQLSKKESCNQSSKLRFVGFWHIGNSNIKKTNSDSSNDQQETGDHIASTGTGSRDEFVLGQLEEIQSAHLFNECNDYDVTLNYVATADLSEQTKQKLSDDPRIHELLPTSIESMDDNEEYFEFPTLMELHSFCLNLPPEDEEDVVVFYLHTKSNDNWRRWMENYLMGEECVQCLEDPGMMACGPSLIDDPSIWQHFSGNFFMTRCQHVRQLNPPYTSKVLDEIHDIQKASKNEMVNGYPHAYPPYGRYAAEYWIMNDAGEKPEHDKHASEWPNLHNTHTQYRPPVINREQICFRHAPHSVVSGEDQVQSLLNWDSTLYDEEKN